MTKHPIPDAVLEQHIIVLGKTRSGKSSTMRIMVEHLLDEEKPVCIVDPKGDWWGLKLSATGKSAGYPIVIFGGPHADVPINAHAGAHVAELFATGNRPCLIDFKGWMVGERTRFWIDFASTLFKLTKGTRWLVVDEVHNFAPKGKIMDPDSGRALHWANRLASEGLGMGLHMICASQRPQKVHNDLLTSAETLIAMRVLHPSDRDAVSEWVKGCGDAKLGAEVLGSLAQMGRGEGWAWSPEIGFGPKRVKFPMFRTYDSFKAQDAKSTQSLKGWASVDLDEVKAKLATVIEEAKANDPRELKGRIAGLERQVREAAAAASKQGQTPDPQAIERADKAGYERGFEEGVQATKTAILPMAQAVTEAVGAVSAAAAALRMTAVPQSNYRPASAAAARLPAQRPPPPANHPPGLPKPAAQNVQAAADGVISGPISRLLDSLAFWRAMGQHEPSRSQVAFVASYSPKSSGFEKALSNARTAGLICYPAGGRVGLDEPGSKHACELSAEEAKSRIMSVLSAPQKRLAAALIAAARPLTREDLAVATAYSDKSSGFEKVLSQLNTMGIARYPNRGQVEITEWAQEILQ